jgi:SAM-dependent methyltransferase
MDTESGVPCNGAGDRNDAAPWRDPSELGMTMHSTSLLTSDVRLTWDSISAFLLFWMRENPLTGAERQVFDRYYSSYRRRFGPYLQHHFAEQTREITAAIRAGGRPRLLEVGPGCGTESLWFALLGADVTAIDLAGDRLAVARARRDWLQRRLARVLPAEFVEGSLFDFTSPKAFDLIWMEQTFHHLEPRARVYGKLFDLLAPDGTLVISESNAWNPLMQLQLFMRRGFKTRTSFVDVQGRRIEYGNERITTPWALCRGLEAAGFAIRSVRPFRMLPNVVDPPERWLAMEDAILRRFPFLSTHFNIVACKRAPRTSE